ncbi:5166_t:CDS:2, partial [Cetraspora pellucida]
IIDEVETIYKEDLKSFENKSVLIFSDNELQEIDNNIARNLNEDTITYFTKKLALKVIYHTLMPIEYPETSSESVAYIYNVEGWKEPLAIFKDIDNIKQKLQTFVKQANEDLLDVTPTHIITELLLTAKLKEVELIFDKLLALDNNLMVQYYKQPYIIASLNPNILKILHDLWYMAPNSTNCAEAAHIM